MARGRKIVRFEEVEILDQWESKKGTKCTKVGWNSKSGSGQQIFYGNDDLFAVPDGTIVNVNCSQDGDFCRVEDFEVLGKVKKSAAA